MARDHEIASRIENGPNAWLLGFDTSEEALVEKRNRYSRLPELERSLAREGTKLAEGSSAWARRWQREWTASRDEPSTLERLERLATLWLERIRGDQKGWMHVWQALWAHARDDPAALQRLAERGFALIVEGRLDRRQWPRVWRALWLYDSFDVDRRRILGTLALRWLRVVGLRRERAPGTFERLYDGSRDDEEMLARLRDILMMEVRRDLSSSAFSPALLQIAWKCARDDALWRDQLSVLMRHVLKTSPGLPLWANAWSVAWDGLKASGLPRQAALLDLGLDWLLRQDDVGPAWARVWLRAWQSDAADPSALLLAARRRFELGTGFMDDPDQTLAAVREICAAAGSLGSYDDAGGGRFDPLGP